MRIYLRRSAFPTGFPAFAVADDRQLRLHDRSRREAEDARRAGNRLVAGDSAPRAFPSAVTPSALPVPCGTPNPSAAEPGIRFQQPIPGPAHRQRAKVDASCNPGTRSETTNEAFVSAGA
ncbi:hypothetical protein GCM10009533_23540 [Saccharopolyspora spinosporotrichia]|uniref:Uncharacterized protein n=1 Tax=Saccharopolyspora erythraea TaxID=1836 RepID=A0ABN1CQ31_SACER